MDIKILEIDASYAKTLSELAKKLFVETFGYANTPEELDVFLQSTYTPEIQTEELNNPNMYTYMAFDQDDTPIAFCQLNQSKDVYDFIGDPEAIELKRIYVARRCAGKGVGKKLLTECLSKAKELNKKTMWLGVWEFNPSAIKFYQSRGFRKVGAHIFKIGSKEDTDEIMVKDL